MHGRSLIAITMDPSANASIQLRHGAGGHRIIRSGNLLMNKLLLEKKSGGGQ